MMTRSLLIALVLIVYMIYAAFKYKKIWKSLSLWQIAGVFLTFVGVISISGLILFYGSRFVTSIVSGVVTGFIIKFFAIIIVIAAAAITFGAIASKVTNGMIPIERKDDQK